MKQMPKKILVIDDEIPTSNLISRFFHFNNYCVKTAATSESGRKLFEEFQPDVVILDVNLPDETGFNLCQEFSESGTIVLMLSSMTDDQYVLKGFSQGADDYMTKPFSLPILKAKIEAILKRYQASNHISEHNQYLVFDDIVIDTVKREVTVAQEPVFLTPIEFKLLYFLATNPYQVWQRADLVEQVWQKEEQSDRKVDIHIGHIRRKIGDDRGKIIKTVWGKGYKFEPPYTHELKLAN